MYVWCNIICRVTFLQFERTKKNDPYALHFSMENSYILFLSTICVSCDFEFVILVF